MKTFAVALVSLLEGSFGCTSDLQFARYHALVESVQGGFWEVAAELEAVPVREGGFSAEAEMLRATHIQACELMLQQTLASLREAQPGIG